MKTGSIVLLTGLLAIAGCKEPNTFVPPPPPTVTVAAPDTETVTTYIDFTGRTESPERVNVRARVQGYLQSVDFTEGEMVEAGQQLFQIEPDSYQTALASARARRDSAKARLSLAEATLTRTQEAFDRGAATSLEVTTREAERDEARAAVDEAEAEVERAELNLSYTTVSSPITGRADRELVTRGNLVGAGEATLLTTVLVDDPLHVYFDIDERSVLQYLERRPRAERDAERVPAFLTLLSGDDFGQVGEVDFVSNTVNPDTGTLQARATFPNPDGRLFPGMFVRVRLPEDPVDAVLVPQVAVQRDQQGPYLMVVGDGDTVERRNITTSRLVGDRIIVTDGVTTTDRVIVTGVQRAREGAQVDPQEQAPARGGAATPATGG